MPLKIPVPKVSFATNTVPLGGQSYNFTFRFNERSNNGNGRWKLDISTIEGKVVVNGLTLIEGAPLTSHLYLPDFSHGVLFVVKRNEGLDLAGRNNLGIGKQYELLYFSQEELSV